MLTNKEEIIKQIQIINSGIQKRQMELLKLREQEMKLCGALELLEAQAKKLEEDQLKILEQPKV